MNQPRTDESPAKRCLDEVLGRLYETFASYPLTELGYHPVVAEELVDHLLETPLRALSFEALYAYVMAAMTTLGDVPEFKHFVPRLCEFCAYESGDFDTFCWKLSYAEWRRWPDEERVVVEDFFDALWRYVLEDDWEQWFAYGFLFHVRKTEWDVPISRYLETWENAEGLTATMHLVELVRVLNTGDEDDPPFVAMLRDWFRDTGMARRLREAFDTFPADQDRTDLEVAIAFLDAHPEWSAEQGV